MDGWMDGSTVDCKPKQRTNERRRKIWMDGWMDGWAVNCKSRKGSYGPRRHYTTVVLTSSSDTDVTPCMTCQLRMRQRRMCPSKLCTGALMPATRDTQIRIRNYDGSIYPTPKKRGRPSTFKGLQSRVGDKLLTHIPHPKRGEDHQPLKDCSPVLGTNYIQLEWFCPEHGTGLYRG